MLAVRWNVGGPRRDSLSRHDLASSEQPTCAELPHCGPRPQPELNTPHRFSRPQVLLLTICMCFFNWIKILELPRWPVPATLSVYPLPPLPELQGDRDTVRRHSSWSNGLWNFDYHISDKAWLTTDPMTRLPAGSCRGWLTRRWPPKTTKSPWNKRTFSGLALKESTSRYFIHTYMSSLWCDDLMRVFDLTFKLQTVLDDIDEAAWTQEVERECGEKIAKVLIYLQIFI